MRYTADEKREIIKLVEQSSLPISQTLKRLDINKWTFYNWLGRYRIDDIVGPLNIKDCFKFFLQNSIDLFGRKR